MAMPHRSRTFHARTTALVVAVLTATGLLAACAPGGPASAPASGSPAADHPAGGVVRLLAHDSFAVSTDLVADFEKRTGLTLEILTGGNAGSVVAGAVLAAGQPTADVLYGIDGSLVSRAVDAGVFTAYASPALSDVIASVRTDTADGLLTPIDYGDVCVNYDAAALAARDLRPPTTLEDLADPAYRDLLVVEDPAASSPGLSFLLATIARYGDAWPQYWARLRDNGVAVASSWTDAYEGRYTVGGGDRPMVVSYATSPPAEIVYAAEPKPATPPSSVMTDGCYRQVEYAGVLAGAQNPDGARQVVDWLLSEPVQADIPLSMFVFPARDRVPLPEVFTDNAAAVSAPLTLPPATIDRSLSEWLARWGTVMGR